MNIYATYRETWGRKYFEIEKKELFIENDRLLEHIIWQDVMCIAMHADLDNKCVVPTNDDNLAYTEMEQSFIDEYSSVSDCIVQVNNSCVIALEMYKLDFEPLSPKLRKNREAHVDYLKKAKEHADTLHDIIVEARSRQPLDSALDYACKFTTRIQELLVYLSATCPSSLNMNEKLVAITLMNKSKKVRSFKINKKKDWKPTGKVFTNVGHRWIPTGQTFTIDGTKFPLTRITSTIVVPPKRHVPAKLVKNTPTSRTNLGKPKAKSIVSSISKSRIVESRISNNSEPNKIRDPMFPTLHLLLVSNACRTDRPLVFGLGLLQTHDETTLSAHQFCQQVYGHC
ncbi:hypothetical protein Tco_0296739 [Tanacetum coccineum]